jgi:hypothetical protein
MSARSPGNSGVTHFEPGAAGESDPAVIEAEIEATRDEMTETIGAIQDRLDPDRLSAQAITTATEVTDQAREAAKEVVRFAIDEAKTAVNDLASNATTTVRAATVGKVEEMMHQTRHTAEYAKGGFFETIKQHPVPAALTAIGIGWLWSHRAGGTERSHASAYGGRDWNMPPSYLGAPYYGAYGAESQGHMQSGSGAQQMTDRAVGQVQETAGQVQEKAGQMVGQVQHEVGQMGHQVQERAGLMGHQVQERAGQMQHQAQGFWQMLESNPVAIGALGVVVGGAVGLLLPETEQEHQLMGETRDRVIGSVQEMAGEKIEQAQRVVAEAGQAAMETGQAALRDA